MGAKPSRGGDHEIRRVRDAQLSAELRPDSRRIPAKDHRPAGIRRAGRVRFDLGQRASFPSVRRIDALTTAHAGCPVPADLARSSRHISRNLAPAQPAGSGGNPAYGGPDAGRSPRVRRWSRFVARDYEIMDVPYE